MAEFFDNVDRINKLAERVDGFIWRLEDASGNALNIRVYDDPDVVPNLTIWRDVESLRRFVFSTVHKRFFDRREKWFLPLPRTSVLWRLPAGEKPSMEEGVRRLDHLISSGPTRHAFTWKEAEQFMCA